jgi:hypothetical protein
VNVYRVTYRQATGVGNHLWANEIDAAHCVVADTAADAVTMVMAPLRDHDPDRYKLSGVLVLADNTFDAIETRRGWAKSQERT